jgi:phage-related protein
MGIRVRLNNRIARVLFALEGKTMILLHGFIKKQQATPKPDLDLARDRLKHLRRK